LITQPLLTSYQSQYYAWLLTRRAASDTVDSLAATLVDSQVDLNQDKFALQVLILEAKNYNTIRKCEAIVKIRQLAASRLTFDYDGYVILNLDLAKAPARTGGKAQQAAA
jgi:hypothetical protein